MAAAETACPQCGARVSPSDTHCLECGVDLFDARRKLRLELQEQSLNTRSGPNQDPRIARRGQAAAGLALPGESSKKTRLQIYDQRAAEALHRGALFTLALAAVVLLASSGLLVFGLTDIHEQGLAQVLSVRPVVLQSLKGYSDPRVTALMVTGLGCGALLTAGGLLRRSLSALRAINLVRQGEKPPIPGLNLALQAGLLVMLIACPPLGLGVGLLLRFNPDGDLRSLGSRLIGIALVLLIVLAVNIFAGSLEDFLLTGQSSQWQDRSE